MSEKTTRSATPRGRFITLEGIEGAGKSTAIAEIEGRLKKRGIDALATREPGGTTIAEALRELVLSPREDEQMDGRSEALLVFAARAQHVARVIRPALESGRWVVCDRFTDATFAYQGGGRGEDMERLRWLADWVHGDLWPDLTLLMDLPEEQGLARALGRGDPDRFEREAQSFFTRVRDTYRDLAASEPGRYRVVDAGAPLAEVRRSVAAVIDDFLDASES